MAAASYAEPDDLFNELDRPSEYIEYKFEFVIHK